MATRRPDPAAPMDASGRRFLEERMHVQQRCLGVLAHQLGNAASPIAMVAEVLQLDSQLARRDAAVATLRRIAGVLAQLTAVTRSLRGSRSPGQLGPRGIANMADWWNLYCPFAESMLPETVKLEAALGPCQLSPNLADALTWILPVCIAHVHAARPVATVITLSSVERQESDTVSFDIEAMGAAPLADTSGQELRWLSFGRFLVHENGGDLVESETDVCSRLVLQLPLSPA